MVGSKAFEVTHRYLGTCNVKIVLVQPDTGMTRVEIVDEGDEKGTSFVLPSEYVAAQAAKAGVQ